MRYICLGEYGYGTENFCRAGTAGLAVPGLCGSNAAAHFAYVIGGGAVRVRPGGGFGFAAAEGVAASGVPAAGGAGAGAAGWVVEPLSAGRGGASAAGAAAGLFDVLFSRPSGAGGGCKEAQ